jgi:hypothetical protein
LSSKVLGLTDYSDNRWKSGIKFFAGETEAAVHERDKKLGWIIMGLVLGIPLAIGLLSFIVGIIVGFFI